MHHLISETNFLFYQSSLWVWVSMVKKFFGEDMFLAQNERVWWMMTVEMMNVKKI